jgi:hypothetical protein
MSFAKSVPEGHKLSECKQGIGGKNSRFRYLPKKDHVQEALEKIKKPNYFKLTIPHMGSKLKVALWASGTPEQFILHMRSAIHTCKQMEHDIKFSKAEETVANAIFDLEIKKEEYAQVCSSERKKTKGNKGESVPAACESLVAAKLAYKKPNRL